MSCLQLRQQNWLQSWQVTGRRTELAQEVSWTCQCRGQSDTALWASRWPGTLELELVLPEVVLVRVRVDQPVQRPSTRQRAYHCAPPAAHGAVESGRLFPHTRPNACSSLTVSTKPVRSLLGGKLNQLWVSLHGAVQAGLQFIPGIFELQCRSLAATCFLFFTQLLRPEVRQVSMLV